MPTLAVQEYLRSGGTLDALTSKFSIHVKRHPEFPSLALLKYDQIASQMSEEIVRDCRGLILDEADNWRAVSLAFRKFFNHGEGHAAKIDWDSARVQEKLDGSLMQLYWHAGAWRVASSGTPDAGGTVGNGIDAIRFADLFWQTWKAEGYELPPDGMRGWCFAFELTAPHNRVVVRHAEPKITLIGARNLDNLEETPAANFADACGWRLVSEHPLDSFDGIIETFRDMNPLQQEGYVIVDGDFNRVKVKHPGYVALHHLTDGMGPRRVVEIVRSGEISEVLTAFPEFAKDFEMVKERYEALAADLDAQFAALAHIPVAGKEEQKLFAASATKSKVSGCLFQRRLGRVASTKDYLRDMQIDALMAALDVRPTDAMVVR